MDPYRTIAERPKEHDRALHDPDWAHGELIIAAMLIAVGGLGVCVGLIGGGGRELPLGMVMLMGGLEVLLVEWRSARLRESRSVESARSPRRWRAVRASHRLRSRSASRAR